MAAFFFGADGDGHWYKVPSEIRGEWQDWCNLPEPTRFASDDDWNRYETPPARAERCNHPSTYNLEEVAFGD